MSKSEVILGLRVVSLDCNFKSSSEIKNFKRQNRKTSKANQAEIHHSQRAITTIKKLEIYEKVDHIVSLYKVARNPHLIFIH